MSPTPMPRWRYHFTGKSQHLIWRFNDKQLGYIFHCKFLSVTKYYFIDKAVVLIISIVYGTARFSTKMYKSFNLPQDQSPDVPDIQSLFHSNLFRRRAESKERIIDVPNRRNSNYDDLSDFSNGTTNSEESFTNILPAKFNAIIYSTTGVNSSLTGGMSFDTMACSRCGEGFDPHEKIVNSTGELWHQQCFVCAQCFRPFKDGVFYEFEGRKYCEHDFQVLFAPCCGKCGRFVIGRVIKAMNANWHPTCFCCEMCNVELADSGFIRNAGRALCHECNAKVKAVGLGKYVCHKCHGLIDDQPLKFRGEVYHPYHFNCTACGVELDSSAREVRSRPGFANNDMNELYCLRCHDKMGIPICGACRRPIEERVVTALGKHWHVEHFVCAKCEKPFFGHRHYEKKGLAYCETHYHQLFGNLCFVCNQVIASDVFTALNKAWCVHHFACSLCDQKMNQKTKFYEFDLKPACKKCYEKLPMEFRRRLRRQHEATPKKSAPA